MKRHLVLALTTVIVLVLLFGGFKIYEAERDLGIFYAAARNGDAPTQTSMGFYYYRGDPFPQDYAKAMKWWRRAADQGYAEAQFNVGHMYWLGEGVSKDAVQAYMWATLAAKQNNERAIQSIPDLEKSMSHEQVAEAKHRASEWKPTPEAKPLPDEVHLGQ